MTRVRHIGDAVKLRIKYTDRSRYGSAVTNRCDDTVRAACASAIDLRRRSGLVAVVDQCRALLEQSELGIFYSGRGRIREEVLYPAPELVRPEALIVERRGRQVTLAISSSLTRELASWIGDWARGAEPPAAGEARDLWQRLDAAGAFDDDARGHSTRASIATFVGHATVSLSDGKRSLLVDPMFSPHGAERPGYRPFALSDFGTDFVVLITHSHPDHFDVGDLLRVGADTPIVVPVVGRESVLAIDMAARLRDLGFRDVRAMAWFEQMRIGDFAITALPFYGEQPTWGERYHPEARNHGNLYLVELHGRRFLFTADAGADCDGDVRAMSLASRPQHGSADLVFGGHRGFGVYPVQYLFSTVARYLLFVPPSWWNVRQRCMADEHELLDVAEIWGADAVIPYAAGGAPWHWEHGLGPDATQPEMATPLDPPPERVIDAAAHRAGVRGAWLTARTKVMVLRPGDGLTVRDKTWTTTREDPHAWPFG